MKTQIKAVGFDWKGSFAFNGGTKVDPALSILAHRFIWLNNAQVYVVGSADIDDVKRRLAALNVDLLFNANHVGWRSNAGGISHILRSESLCNPKNMLYISDSVKDVRIVARTGVTQVGIITDGADEASFRSAGAAVTFPSLTAFHDALIRGDL